MTAITLGGVELPDDLQWTDEYAWSPVARSFSGYGLTGAPIIQESLKQAGRPITLTGGDWAWVSTETLTALYALHSVPDSTHSLVLADSRNFTVRFKDAALDAKPVFFEAPEGAAGGWWFITLYLMTA